MSVRARPQIAAASRRPRRLGTVALIVVVCCLPALAVLHVVGYRALVVHSDSMAPALGGGDLIVSELVRATDVAVGDVVSFRDRSRAGRLVTHRVAAVHRRGTRVAFVTRGDANTGTERWATRADDRLGRRALGLAHTGSALTWLTHPVLVVTLIALAALLLARAAIRSIWTASRAGTSWRVALAALLAPTCLLRAHGTLIATDAAFAAVTSNPANAFSAAASFCAAGGSLAATASADTWVGQSGPNANHGGGSDLEVMSFHLGANERTLVNFTLPTIPAGCSVISATLKLTDGGFYASGRTIQVKRATSSWTENAVTWNTQPTSTTTDMATQPSGPGSLTFTITNQLIAMYAGANDGFLIRDSAEDSTNLENQLYAAREGGASTAPKLTVNYG